MKRKSRLATLAAFFLSTLTVFALELTWDDPNPPGTVKEFHVFRIENGATNLIITVTNNITPIPFLIGTNRLTVTAIGHSGLSSEFSEPLEFYILAPVTNVQLIVPLH